MSWKATAIVKGLTEGLTRSEKFVLLVLSDYHNDETGRCDPSVSRLAKECLMSERQLVRVLHSLDRKELVQIERRWSNGHQQTSQYHLLLLGDMMSGGDKTGNEPGKTDISPPSRLTQLCHPNRKGTVRDLRSSSSNDLSDHSQKPPPPAAPKETSPIKSFYTSQKVNDQVAALIDIGRMHKVELDGARLGAMLRQQQQLKYPKQTVLLALQDALGRNVAVVEDYMQGELRRYPERGGSRNAKGGRGTARPSQGVVTAEDIARAKAGEW